MATDEAVPRRAIDGDLALMLRPAGGGIHTVSSGRAEQLELQRRIYGATTTATIESRWHDALAAVPRARVAVLGIPSDTGAGLVRGAAFGPGGVRAAVLEALPDYPARARAAGIVDVGDVFVVPQLLHDDMLSEAQREATRAAIYAQAAPEVAARLPVSPLSMAEAVARRLLALNPQLKLFTLGGDHSVAWPVFAALFAAVRAPRVPGIVHVDAHTDLMPQRLGVRHCFATWAFHANELIGRRGRLLQIGVRASGRSREHWEGTLGVKQIWADEVAAHSPHAVLDGVVAHLAAAGVTDVYLSNDIDGTDAAAAPSTGAPEGGGLSVEFVRALIARLGRDVSLLGGDLVEVAPTIGAPAAALRTVEVGARYVLDTLAALTGADELRVP